MIATRTTDLTTLQPRIMVNGFPKAGTHLALSLVMAIVSPWSDEVGEEIQAPYFGTFKHNSFSVDWLPHRPLTWAVLHQPPGTWMKGHCGHFPQLEQSFDAFGHCIINIYRDLRDVAVSLLHHIEDDDGEHLKHAERDLYLDLPTSEDRLVAIIEGIGYDPGLIARWEYYAPWLAVDWVLSLRFEKVIADKEAAARQVLDYVIARTAAHNDMIGAIINDDYERLIERTMFILARPKVYSKTYRKGKAGGWRDYWTPRVAAAFAAAGGDVWTERLGYAPE